ncbi:AT-rich interactive domain-containing protein 5-like [Bidens hawaiensis]|uniref:AT-rich interactive domain-containing protein 5-like n=1 Tax=Bidens hawaiensis TaxID=980011 RepID=UPI00404A5A22
MDQRDIEMEDAGKLLEDEVLNDQECVENDQRSLKEVEDKQEESSGLVNSNPNEVGISQENLSKVDEVEVHPSETEQELPVDEAHDSKNDDTETGDDKIDDSNNDATETGDYKIDDSKNDATETGDDKIDDSKNDATEIGDDKIDDSKNDATETGDDNKIDDSKNDATHAEDDHDSSMKIPETNKEPDHTGHEKHQQLVISNALVDYSPNKANNHFTETPKHELESEKMDEDYDSRTEEDQEIFMKEVDAVYKEKGLEFKPPKFYGQPLNCFKLWKSVIKLGGYDRVTGSKLWRQIGESFHPPKTCTTVSWTFRQFYEKALLEYERHKIQIGELEFPLSTVFPEAHTAENEANGHQTPGSGRAWRDAAARAMQGWHAQRLLGFGEEKNANNSQKRDKGLKSIGSIKQKRPSEVEHSVKAMRTETSRQVVTTVADVGPPANWVTINVRETKDCFEVYALVPGLLREEVRVQSDPAGRLVITGQPEQPDNPWGISAFKKVISLPSRIDPLRTSAIVSLHGRLLVRVPFEQSNM